MSYDAVVIGAGLAGLSAALRLAESGLRVAVVARGVGSLHLGGATIDVLGYAEDRIEDPAAALSEFVVAYPEHPYARVGPRAVADSIEWFKARMDVPFVGGLDRNGLYPTAVGVLKPSAVVPASIAGGDASNGGRIVIAGFPALKDFYAGYAAANLTRSGIVSARAIEVDVALPGPLAGEADPGSLGLARSFEDPEFRKAVAAALDGEIDADEVMGVPAVLGLDDAQTVRNELSDALGRTVFEIPTLPPSIPGIRLYRHLVRRLKAAGGRLVIGPSVVGARGHGERIEEVRVDTGARIATYKTGAVVLASGGVAAGGIELDSRWRFKEPVFGLPLTGAPGAGEPRFSPQYFRDHPVDRIGISVDDDGRPTDPGGEVVWKNLFAAGALLAGARPWAEKSGNGISLATGWQAAGSILEGRA